MADTPVSPASKLRAALVHLSPAPAPAPAPLLSNGVEDEEEEEGLDALEKQVREIGDRLKDFRSTLPALFHGVLESFLASKRPSIPRVGLKEGRPQIGDGTDRGMLCFFLTIFFNYKCCCFLRLLVTVQWILVICSLVFLD